MRFTDAIGDWLRTGVHDGWCWVTGLDFHEWFLLLALVTVFGFMCMRGFGSRSDY